MSRFRILSQNTPFRFRQTTRRWILSAVALHVSAVVALAQRPGRVPDEDGGSLQWIVMLGVGVVICLTGFLNSKRSHLN